MAEDLGLFPEPSRGRYIDGTRIGQRDWTLPENFVLLPVLFACESDRAYQAAVRMLCRELDREPIFGENQKPTEAERQRERVSLIERRTVTELMLGRVSGQSDFADRLWRGFRRNRPLTWVERIKFIRPYLRKPKNCQTAILVQDFSILLDRTILDRTLMDYIETVKTFPDTLTEVERLDVPPPTGSVTAALVRGFVETPADDFAALGKIWAALWQSVSG